MRNHGHHNQQKTIAVYPGSFDPITNGHLDVIERATYLFDEVFVLVAHNPDKGTGMFTPKDRVQLILDSVHELVGKSVRADYMQELVATVDICDKIGARAMIRGLRTITDFDSEFELAIANMELAPHIETVFMVPKPANHFVSSSKVREIWKLRGAESVKGFVPPPVFAALKKMEETP
jgi:pantetheine-phosphate adenylyltransferase